MLDGNANYRLRLVNNQQSGEASYKRLKTALQATYDND